MADKLWSFEDFANLDPLAVAAALSRLNKTGELRRVRRGLYHRPQTTAFGASSPILTPLPMPPCGARASNLWLRASRSTTVWPDHSGKRRGDRPRIGSAHASCATGAGTAYAHAGAATAPPAGHPPGRAGRARRLARGAFHPRCRSGDGAQPSQNALATGRLDYGRRAALPAGGTTAGARAPRRDRRGPPGRL